MILVLGNEKWLFEVSFKTIVELITVINNFFLFFFFQREYDKQEDTLLDASTTEEEIHICTVRIF